MSQPQIHSHLKKILRQFHFLSWPQNQGNSTSLFYENMIFCLSRSFIPTLILRRYQFLFQPQVHSVFNKILRGFHFLSQPKIHSNYKKRFCENFIFCLGRKFNQILQIYSKTLSFSVLAANSFQFYEKFSRKFHFLSQPKIHSILKKKSMRNSFFVLAANSTKFYNFILREIFFCLSHKLLLVVQV